MPAFCSLLLPNHYAKIFAGEIDGSLAMTQEGLNGLAVMQYHHQIPLEADEVVEEFAIRQPRKPLL